MTEEKKSFTVSDRRHFTPEGEARGPGEERQPGSATAAPPADSQARRPEPPPGPRPEPEAGPASGAPVDFVGLLLSLGSQAAVLLGGDPGEEGSPPDFEGARAFINLLEVLQEKTQGRRTPEEDQVLDSLLYQLRMEYVSRTQVKGA